MLEVPKRISHGEMSTYRSLRGLASASSGVLLGGAFMARTQAGPRVARFGANVGTSLREVTGLPGPIDHAQATRLEQGELAGQARWPQVDGYESREHFIGRQLVSRPEARPELTRVLKVEPSELASLRADLRSAGGQERLRQLGSNYALAQGRLVHDLDVSYLNALRRGRLAPLRPDRADTSS
jgi:hypothetical protein